MYAIRSYYGIKGSQPELNTVVHMFRDITKKKMDLALIMDIVSHINTAHNNENDQLLNNKSLTQNIV